MKVNDPSLSHLASTEASKAQQAQRTANGPGSGRTQGGEKGAHDDVHLSELVRSLRSLAAESPERQERLEQIARTNAAGTYQVDAGRTADGIIEDALHYS